MFQWIKRLLGRLTGKHKYMSEQQLTDITRGMHHAASTTAAMIAQQYIRIIDQFFDKRPDGTLEAKMVKIYITEKEYMMVPLISLVSPKGISLEKMRVEMSVRITETTLKEATDQVDNSNATRSSMKVQLAPKHKDNFGKRRDDLTEIEMIFTAGDPPEGIMRIIDDYTNLIKPLSDKEAPGEPASATYHTIGIKGANGDNGNKEAFGDNPGNALEPISEGDTKEPIGEDIKDHGKKDETKILSDEDFKPDVDDDGKPKTPENSEPTDE